MSHYRRKNKNFTLTDSYYSCVRFTHILQNIKRHTTVVGDSWPWRNDDMAGIHRANFIQGGLIVAYDTEFRALFAHFLNQVVPGIAASVRIIEYEVKHTSDAKAREFAERVLKQHKESVKTASGHAKRLNVAVDARGDKDSKEMIDKLSGLKGADLDVAFLEWLSHIHHDTTLFENEVKNGSDAELKAYAKGSIEAGNEHHKEASELLAKLKK